MNKIMRMQCEGHRSECILLGASPDCSEKAVVCAVPQCMHQHSIKLNEHNFYGIQDFNQITKKLHESYEETLSLYKNKLSELIDLAITQLNSYKTKQMALIQQNCFKIFSKIPQQQRTVERVVKGEFQTLKCYDVAFIYSRWAQQKHIDYAGLEQLQELIETAVIDIADNNNIFKLENIRKSNYDDTESQMDNIKKRITISCEDIQNQNIRLLHSRWQKLNFTQQEQLNETIRNINWETDEWDLSDGYFHPFDRVLSVSISVKAKELKILKLFNNDLKVMKGLSICKFQNLKSLFLASNRIESIEMLPQLELPSLERISLCKIITLLWNFPPLERQVAHLRVCSQVDNNLILDVRTISLWNFPTLSQLSLHHNDLVDEEYMIRSQFPKLYYLNLKNKDAIRSFDKKNIKQHILGKKYNEVLL